MFDLGWLEILIIAITALIVVGPKDFPLIVKKIGSWVGNIKRYVNNIQDEFTNLEQKNIDIDLNEKKKKDWFSQTKAKQWESSIYRSVIFLLEAFGFTFVPPDNS